MSTPQKTDRVGPRRPLHEEPATALRAALASPYPTLKSEAERIVIKALSSTKTLPEAAAKLGVSRQTMSRLRAEYPQLRAVWERGL